MLEQMSREDKFNLSQMYKNQMLENEIRLKNERQQKLQLEKKYISESMKQDEEYETERIFLLKQKKQKLMNEYLSYLNLKNNEIPKEDLTYFHNGNNQNKYNVRKSNSFHNNVYLKYSNNLHVTNGNPFQNLNNQSSVNDQERRKISIFPQLNRSENSSINNFNKKCSKESYDNNNRRYSFSNKIMQDIPNLQYVYNKRNALLIRKIKQNSESFQIFKENVLGNSGMERNIILNPCNNVNFNKYMTELKLKKFDIRPYCEKLRKNYPNNKVISRNCSFQINRYLSHDICKPQYFSVMNISNNG